MRSFWRRNKGEILLAVIVLIVALVPRVIDLGGFLTADEKNWIGRSYEYIKAFKDWRFNDMLQTTHPGVTTLWLSGIAVTGKMLIAHIPFSFANLIHFVKVAQLAVALANVGLVLAIYLLLRKLWPRKRFIAVLAALMIAIDPLLVGYSRVVHVDAMLGGFMMAAAIAILGWGKYGFNRRWLVLSAGLAALAMLTKAPAIYLGPYLILVGLVFARGKLRDKMFMIDRARDILIWLLLVGIVVVVVWPAILWVPNPEGNVLVLKRDLSRAAVTPHHMASEYKLNSSFYWYTILSRATPLTLGMVLVALVGLLFECGQQKSARQGGLVDQRVIKQTLASGQRTAKEVWLLVAYVLFFIVMMMLGAKKGDRYILPVFFALDILAAYGIWYLTVAISYLLSRYAKFKQRRLKLIGGGLAIIVIVYLGAVVYQYHPYAIAYSNPWLPDNLSQELGWGEGLEQVGRWLNEHDPKAVVASWYPEELGAYTTARVAHINAHEQSKVKYVVLYRNMFGREPDHWANDFIDEYYRKKEPVYVVRIAGKEFAWIYEKKVYDRVLGEIIPGQIVSQEVEVKYRGLAGIDLMLATYSGQATKGSLLVGLFRKEDDERVGWWEKPVEEINDKGWTSFLLEKPSAETGQYVIRIMTTNTAGKAPTVRYSESDYRTGSMAVNGQMKPGDLAIRLRYAVGGEIATEDDEKRLP